MSRCFLCGSESSRIIQKGVRGNPGADVLKCSGCGLVRLSEFLKNPGEYYEKSMMRAEDPESNLKEIRSAAAADDIRRYNFINRMIENRSYLDFGCGAGGVLKLAQDKAKAVYGVELETKMADVLNGEGIKCYSSIKHAQAGLKGMIDVISLFHVLEHLEDPLEYLNELKELLPDGGVMVIETPNSDDALLSLYKCREFAAFTYWESHLYLYNNTTFSMLMEKAGLKIRFLGQIQRYPLSNTMYWLARGKPGGHKEWAALSSGRLDAEYGSTLAGLGIADTIISVVEKDGMVLPDR